MGLLLNLASTLSHLILLTSTSEQIITIIIASAIMTPIIIRIISSFSIDIEPSRPTTKVQKVVAEHKFHIVLMRNNKLEFLKLFFDVMKVNQVHHELQKNKCFVIHTIGSCAACHYIPMQTQVFSCPLRTSCYD